MPSPPALAGRWPRLPVAAPPPPRSGTGPAPPRQRPAGTSGCCTTATARCACGRWTCCGGATRARAGSTLWTLPAPATGRRTTAGSPLSRWLSCAHQGQAALRLPEEGGFAGRPQQAQALGSARSQQRASKRALMRVAAVLRRRWRAFTPSSPTAAWLPTWRYSGAATRPLVSNAGAIQGRAGRAAGQDVMMLVRTLFQESLHVLGP